MSPRTEAQNKVIREQARQQIIDAAFELFAEIGYQKTSIAAIANSAGVSKGLIYHYFESKEEILIGIFDMLTAMGDQIIDAGAEKSPKEHLKDVLDQVFQFVENQTGLAKLMIGLSLQSDALETLREKVEHGNRDQIEKSAQIFKDLGYDDPKTEAFFLGATLDGVLMGYITMGDEYPLENVKKVIFEKYELT